MRLEPSSLSWALIARLELRQLCRSRMLWGGLLVVLLLGGIATLHGASRVARERAAVLQLEPELREQVGFLTRVTSADDDLGLLLYYLAMPVSREPEAWAAAATGLRGIHPESRHLRTTGLVPQLYPAEVSNPAAEHAGHFDLAYVLTFLMPLLLIGLGHDVRSRDAELGTDALVASQPVGWSRLVALRLALRAALVGAAALGSLGFAALVFGAPLDARALALAAGVLAYVGITSLLIFVVASWNRSSAFNALLLSSGWIASAVLVPALINLAMQVAWPLRGGIELTLEQRLDMNGRWDDPKAATMAPFLARHPEWAGTRVPGDRFSSPWYYAAHEMADQSVSRAVDAYRASLERRALWTARAGLLLPPLGLELLFEHVAGSDLTTALAYRDSVARYHEQLKDVFYPWIFRFQGLSAFRLEQLPRHRFVRDDGGGSLPGLPGLLAQLLLLSGLAPLAARRLDAAPGRLSPAVATSAAPGRAPSDGQVLTDDGGGALVDQRSSEG